MLALNVAMVFNWILLSRATVLALGLWMAFPFFDMEMGCVSLIFSCLDFNRSSDANAILVVRHCIKLFSRYD